MSGIDHEWMWARVLNQTQPPTGLTDGQIVRILRAEINRPRWENEAVVMFPSHSADLRVAMAAIVPPTARLIGPLNAAFDRAAMDRAAGMATDAINAHDPGAWTDVDDEIDLIAFKDSHRGALGVLLRALRDADDPKVMAAIRYLEDFAGWVDHFYYAFLNATDTPEGQRA
jgi:hypothetical protein